MICLHNHIGQCTRILSACIGLHSAIHCFMEFKRVRDLWTELKKILTFNSVFCSLLVLVFSSVYLRMPKNHMSNFKIFFIASTFAIVKVREFLYK